MKSERLKRLCLSGVFTALVYVFTAYFHIPANSGYVHIGDGFLFLAACLLPRSYAAAVGVTGAVLADCLTGFPLWAPASAVIKALSAVAFTSRRKTLLCKQNLLALLPAFALCVGGYYLYEAVIVQNFVTPLVSVPGGIVQSVLSSVLFVAVAAMLDKLHIKQHL